jgi:hypothetical protein
VAHYRTVNLGNERHGELFGHAQRVDNQLFCVARMLGVEKRGYGYGSIAATSAAVSFAISIFILTHRNCLYEVPIVGGS